MNGTRKPRYRMPSSLLDRMIECSYGNDQSSPLIRKLVTRRDTPWRLRTSNAIARFLLFEDYAWSGFRELLWEYDVIVFGDNALASLSWAVSLAGEGKRVLLMHPNDAASALCRNPQYHLLNNLHYLRLLSNILETDSNLDSIRSVFDAIWQRAGARRTFDWIHCEWPLIPVGDFRHSPVVLAPAIINRKRVISEPIDSTRQIISEDLYNPVQDRSMDTSMFVSQVAMNTGNLLCAEYFRDDNDYLEEPDGSRKSPGYRAHVKSVNSCQGYDLGTTTSSEAGKFPMSGLLQTFAGHVPGCHQDIWLMCQTVSLLEPVLGLAAALEAYTRARGQFFESARARVNEARQA